MTNFRHPVSNGAATHHNASGSRSALTGRYAPGRNAKGRARAGRTGARVTLVGLCLALVTILFPSVAGAHSATGTMTVTKSEQIGPNRVHVEVGLTYTGDNHLAEDASVSATLTSSTGDTVGPIALARVSADSSLYGAEIDVTGPGTWTAAVTSTNPASSANAPIEVAKPVESTTTTSSTTTSSTTSTSAAPKQNDAAATNDMGGESDNTVLYVGLATLAIIVVGGFALAFSKRSGRN